MRDSKEFDEFVRTQGPRLRRLAYLLCRDVHRAEDLTQSALAKAFRHWGRISSMEHSFAYVSRILVRESTSWRSRASSSELVAGDLTDWQQGVEPDHSDAIAAADEVWRRLGVLPPKQRAVLVLRYYLDLSDEQIAEVMGCSQSTVRSNAARAFAALRAACGDEREVRA